MKKILIFSSLLFCLAAIPKTFSTEKRYYYILFAGSERRQRCHVILDDDISIDKVRQWNDLDEEKKYHSFPVCQGQVGTWILFTETGLLHGNEPLDSNWTFSQEGITNAIKKQKKLPKEAKIDKKNPIIHAAFLERLFILRKNKHQGAPLEFIEVPLPNDLNNEFEKTIDFFLHPEGTFQILGIDVKTLAIFALIVALIVVSLRLFYYAKEGKQKIGKKVKRKQNNLGLRKGI